MDASQRLVVVMWAITGLQLCSDPHWRLQMSAAITLPSPRWAKGVSRGWFLLAFPNEPRVCRVFARIHNPIQSMNGSPNR